jgi:hypothetical protein
MKITVETQPVVKSVTLELTLEEALWLKRIVGRTAGAPELEGRKVVNALWEGLEAQGVGRHTWTENGFIKGQLEVLK